LIKDIDGDGLPIDITWVFASYGVWCMAQGFGYARDWQEAEGGAGNVTPSMPMMNRSAFDPVVGQLGYTVDATKRCASWGSLTGTK